MQYGEIPYVSATDSNNGVSNYVECENEKIFDGGVITLAMNGSIGEAFYQNTRFRPSSDVCVLTPKDFIMDEAVGLFFCTILRKEKFRYNYGRKWNLKQVNDTVIYLPVNHDNVPNIKLMGKYILGLKFSSILNNRF